MAQGNGTKWQLFCGNAFIDGKIINDFDSDSEAAEYAANYEATCYRIDKNGSRTVIYSPGAEDIAAHNEAMKEYAAGETVPHEAINWN